MDGIHKVKINKDGMPKKRVKKKKKRKVKTSI